MRVKILIILLFTVIVAVFFNFYNPFTKLSNAQPSEVEQVISTPLLPSLPEYDIHKETIESGDTFGVVVERVDLFEEESAITQAVEGVYDIGNIVAGKSIDIYRIKDTDELVKVVYQIDTLDELVITLDQDKWTASVNQIIYDIETGTSEGLIDSSLYKAGLDQGLDESTIIALAEVFQWTIDFSMDVRKGDTFEVIYEKRYRNGEYVMPGKILATKFTNEGEYKYGFYYEESDDIKGYYDENGNSLQRAFLKSPVSFKYISSGYTTGNRVVMEVGLEGPHRAIDYAAELGTPIRSIGDGTVTAITHTGCYGNFTTIRHNETYTTRYAHQSKIMVTVGQKVKQGDVIGLVGSTGCSTGPHVHYEMIKNGVKINSLEEEFPPNESIIDKNKPAYFDYIKDFRQQLDKN